MKENRIKKTIVLFFLSIQLLILASGCGNDSSRPLRQINKDKVKIGVIYLDDATSGYSYAHSAGIKQMQNKLALKDNQIITKLNVSGVDIIAVEHVIKEAIAEGANVIIATSWGYMDACEKLAKEYPDIIFAHASGYKNNDTNFTNYFGRIYQARYLSGVAAGLKTKTNKLGYVAAMNKTNSEVTGGLNAFALGVESVNADAKIYVYVTYSWFDPAAERQAAQKLIDQGCDVIAQHCDTPGPQIEAQKAGVWGIGYNSDMGKEAPNTVLTSVIWNWGVYYNYLISSIIDGSFSTKPYFGSMAEGMVDITPLNSTLITKDITLAVTKARERILSGEFNVFDGVMETNDGRRVGTAKSTFSDSEINSKINWYYHNIIEIDKKGGLN